MIPRDRNGKPILPGMRVRLEGIVLSAPDERDVFVVPDCEVSQTQQIIPAIRARVLEVVEGGR